MGKLAIALLLGLMLALSLALPALATATPTTYEIIETTVWTGYLETGDQLWLIYYDWDIASPTETITDSAIGMINNGIGNVKTALPYTYDISGDLGYHEGIIAMYLTASEVTALNVTWEGTSNVVWLVGNPLLAWTPDYPQTFSNFITWQEYATQSAMLDGLTAYIIGLAQEWQPLWGVTLTTAGTSGTVLTTAGETYFTAAIPQVRNVLPGLFSGGIVPIPTNTPATYTRTEEQAMKANNPSWFTTGVDAMADLAGVTSGFVDAAICLIILVLAVVLAVKLKVNVEWGFIPAAVVMLGAVPMGLVSLTIAGIGAFFCVILMVFMLFLRRA